MMMNKKAAAILKWAIEIFGVILRFILIGLFVRKCDK